MSRPATKTLLLHAAVAMAIFAVAMASLAEDLVLKSAYPSPAGNYEVLQSRIFCDVDASCGDPADPRPVRFADPGAISELSDVTATDDVAVGLPAGPAYPAATLGVTGTTQTATLSVLNHADFRGDVSNAGMGGSALAVGGPLGVFGALTNTTAGALTLDDADGIQVNQLVAVRGKFAVRSADGTIPVLTSVPNPGGGPGPFVTIRAKFTVEFPDGTPVFQIYPGPPAQVWTNQPVRIDGLMVGTSGLATAGSLGAEVFEDAANTAFQVAPRKPAAADPDRTDLQYVRMHQLGVGELPPNTADEQLALGGIAKKTFDDELETCVVAAVAPSTANCSSCLPAPVANESPWLLTMCSAARDGLRDIRLEEGAGLLGAAPFDTNGDGAADTCAGASVGAATNVYAYCARMVSSATATGGGGILPPGPPTIDTTKFQYRIVDPAGGPYGTTGSEGVCDAACGGAASKQLDVRVNFEVPGDPSSILIKDYPLRLSFDDAAGFADGNYKVITPPTTFAGPVDKVVLDKPAPPSGVNENVEFKFRGFQGCDIITATTCTNTLSAAVDIKTWTFVVERRSPFTFKYTIDGFTQSTPLAGMKLDINFPPTGASNPYVIDWTGGTDGVVKAPNKATDFFRTDVSFTLNSTSARPPGATFKDITKSPNPWKPGEAVTWLINFDGVNAPEFNCVLEDSDSDGFKDNDQPMSTAKWEARKPSNPALLGIDEGFPGGTLKYEWLSFKDRDYGDDVRADFNSGPTASHEFSFTKTGRKRGNLKVTSFDPTDPTCPGGATCNQLSTTKTCSTVGLWKDIPAAVPGVTAGNLSNPKVRWVGTWLAVSVTDLATSAVWEATNTSPSATLPGGWLAWVAGTYVGSTTMTVGTTDWRFNDGDGFGSDPGFDPNKVYLRRDP